MHYGIEYHKADASNLDLGVKFDIVTAGFVFSFAPNPTTLWNFIRVASNHLRDNGRLFAIVCNPYNPTRESKVLYRVVPVEDQVVHDGTKLRCEYYDKDGNLLTYDYKFFWSREIITDFLKQHGFTDIQWIPIPPSSDQKKGIPALASTNIALYAVKQAGT